MRTKAHTRAPKALFLAGAALSALTLSACASTSQIGGAPGLEVRQGDLPPPTAADLYATADFVGVRPFDILIVDVFGVAELSQRKVRVDASGEIAFPLVGNMQVAGMTTSQISAMLQEKLKGEFVREPYVTTNLESSENSTFTVYGQVRQPGVFPIVGEGTLLKAVATARGLAEYGNSKEVVVFRTVGGEKLATLYNLEAISRGAYNDPRIYPNDTIVVGDSKARRLFDDVVGVATILVTPLTLVLTQ
ncbi:MAG: polysaccharide biosynthesis/export family protein [Erythrobacter sp.]|uniref:polysaccharide biosynthesis/export family protein n=1 Tax=Erythrobacter sp. TaxID=1042 RepID=UPI00262BC9D9|nr:polysaccharide biosynthesis/export family protein [Erythrobacter sp.]MDJ0978422.1 polysaccharide biosynthesis/export family protein [Erythrobacter sp.]